jgi:hypothetical protein
LGGLPRDAVAAATRSSKVAMRFTAGRVRSERAKGQAHARREIIDNQIATKQDTAVLEANLTTKLAETKADLLTSSPA